MSIDYSAYTILIVDDEINYLVLKATLEKKAFRTIWAPHTNKAAAILERQKIDLIIIDIQALKSLSHELNQLLNVKESLKGIPILFVTTWDSPDDIIVGFDLGGTDYIMKPFHQPEVLKRVEHEISLLHSRHIIQKQQEELQTVVDNRDKLFAIMAHDLRSPLSSLKMILNILVIKTEEHPSESEYADMLYSSSDIAEKLFSLLDNLLKWTKSSLGLLSYLPQKFALEETVLSVIEVLLPTAKLKNISFDIELEDSVSVYFDVDIMKSILRNLLINAVKYSHVHSNILVRLWKEGTRAVLEVKDFGVGMSPQVQAQLKDKISGHSLAGTAQEEGTGLGLWLVQHFLQANNGEFYFESKENEGSRFGIKIPRADVSEQQQSVSI